MNTIQPVSIVDIASYLPGEPVPTNYFTRFSHSDRLAKNVMFRSPKTRYHIAPEETAVDMAEQAVSVLRKRHGTEMVDDIDVLLTHTQLPDNPALGCGPELARRLGIRPGWISDIHNGGCGAFLQLIALVQAIFTTTDARTALLAVMQNCAGPVFTQSEIRKLPQAPVPGDGCGVALVRRDDSSPVLAIECQNHPEYAGDMEFSTHGSRKYWQPGDGQGCVTFRESKIMSVVTRGNRLVPEMARRVCHDIGIPPQEMDFLVTNQPNRMFLRNWHQALEIPAERHLDTFETCGNLFAAGIPVTLDQANQAGRIHNGDLILLAAFAHAGDFAAAAALRWGAADGSPPRNAAHPTQPRDGARPAQPRQPDTSAQDRLSH